MISSFSLAKTGVLLLLLAPNLQKHAKTKTLKNWQIPNRFQSLKMERHPSCSMEDFLFKGILK